MAAGAATTPRDPNLALILEMGGDREDGYDPIPPQQYLAFLDKNVILSNRAHRLLAWVRAHTLRPKRHGRRPPFASDERLPLQLKDAAEDLDWKKEAASRVWAELEYAGFVRKDDRNRLWLCGKVKPRRVPVIPDEENQPETVYA